MFIFIFKPLQRTKKNIQLLFQLTGEIDITDLDDEELDGYIMSEKEANIKSNLWNKINEKYLQEQKGRYKINIFQKSSVDSVCKSLYLYAESTLHECRPGFESLSLKNCFRDEDRTCVARLD